jgi:hypothetical protein
MEYLTTQQIAERYGVEVQTVSGWCKRGLFPNVRLGPKTGRGAIYLVPESDLDGFVPPERGRPTDAVPSAAALAQRQSRQRRRKAQADEPPPGPPAGAGSSSDEPADDQAG